MMKKGLLIGVTCLTSFLVLPVQAVTYDVCTHPTLVEPEPDRAYHGYARNSEEHCEWFQEVEYECTVCGHEFLGNVDYGTWEPHDWDIKWETRDDRGYGLIAYDAECRVCGADGTIFNP